MDFSKIGKTKTPLYKFQIKKNEAAEVHPDKEDIAAEIDVNDDFILDEKEVKTYLHREHLLKDPCIFAVDEKNITEAFKLNMQKKSLPQKDIFPSYEEVMTELKEMEKKYAGLAKRVILGKTHEGRDIVALKISKDVQSDKGDKPGFLVTGTHHAREWASLTATLNMGEKLLENYNSDEEIKKRVDNAEIWIVPLVNPDGYEYSRNNDSFWRKNRRPVYPSDVPPEISEFMTPSSDGTLGYGVDPNRNYYDGNPDHIGFYRPPWDKADNIWDDFSSTSDIPRRDTYRGPEGASEKEIQALLNLWMPRKNIKGMVHHHSYGRLILFPPGVCTNPGPNNDIYMEIGNKMNEAIGDVEYKVQQASKFYPASGVSGDCEGANGRLSFTLEVGESFHESKETVKDINRRSYNANMAFLDWIIEHKEELMKEDEGEKYNIPHKLNI